MTNAFGLIGTWLSTCGIQHEVKKDSLVIQTPDGRAVEVPKSEIDGKALLSTNLDVSVGEFHKVTEKAGHGKPMPVNRGKAEKKRLNADPILSRWRHNEMRTVPNQSTEDLMEYSDLALREARIFVARNRGLCALMGYDVDAAYNDCLVWLNTFLGRYKISGTEDDADGNRRLLTTHFRQRFGEMVRSFYRQKKNVQPESSYIEYMEGLDSEDPDAEWKAAHDEIGYKSPKFRRKKAKELLDMNLATMPHDKLVSTLTEVSESHPCFDTRKAARDYLKAHAGTCAKCAKK